MMLAIERAGHGRSGDPGKDAVARYFKLAGEFKNTMCRCDAKPHFVGVFDTVSSIGWKENPLKLPFISDNPDIAVGCHAISIDERRAFFRSHRWMPSSALSTHGPRDLKQVWFPGVHCDVGGGYPEAESGLSKIALEWMIEEAKIAGLSVDAVRQAEVLGQAPGSAFAPPNPDALSHESLKGLWKLAEWVRKPHYDFKTGKNEMRRNRGRRRTIPPRSLVHESAYRRQGGEYAKRLPPDAIPTATQFAGVEPVETALH
jgi:uncharacterized protein (DUF2235 family)